MKKNIFKIIIFILFLLFICTSIWSKDNGARSKTNIIFDVRIDKIYNKPFVDVNKTPEIDKDDLLCWLMAASNMIAWESKNPKVTGDYVYESYLQNYSYRGGGRIYKAIKELGWFSKYTFIVGDNKFADLWILGSLIKGDIVAIEIVESFTHNDTFAHVLTVYGMAYEFDTNDSEKQKLFLYYVDSDDNIRKLYREEIFINKTGLLEFKTGEYTGWKTFMINALRK